MQFRILGSLEVWHDGDAVPLAGPKQSKVLALLLLEANHTVPLHRFIDAVWGEDPPATAKRQVQNAVAALRRVLAAAGDDPIERIGDGYRLTTTDLDWLHFAADVARARSCMASEQVLEAQDLLTRALDRWRGSALAGTTGGVIASAATRLDEARLMAIEDLIDLEMGLGRHGSVIERARQVLAINPFRQQTAHRMMLALHRSGRSPEALEAYAQLRSTLADELGLDPEDRLQELQQQILAGDPGLETPPAAGDAEPVPRHLPTATSDFSGRVAPLAELDLLLVPTQESSDDRPAAMAVAAVSGTAGVGKTTLALHWAHRAANWFPDGQLYVDLRGFDPGGAPVSPAAAVRGFLDALDVAPERVPPGLDAQVGLYRSLLADKRMLVVLDNARDVGQVRPLLPGGSECRVVVTSRNQLSGLVAVEGAQPVALDLPTESEAYEMLCRRLGRRRVAAEPEAAGEIIDSCARLPLALALVAARAALYPRFRLSALAAELRDAHHRLDAFAISDASSDVRAVFSWSYQAVSADAARLFRLLGLHPGPDATVPAAASLAGMPPRAVRPLLVELAGAHLITEHQPGRFVLHDLLREYAAELAGLHDTDTERHTALHRILDHYVHSAYAADRLLSPARDDIILAPARAGVATEALHDYEQAMAWFTTEHDGLLAAQRQAARFRFDTHAWQLAWSLSNFLDYRGYWQDMVAAWRIGVDAVRDLADEANHGLALRTLAFAYMQSRRFDDAHQHLEDALRLFRELGDHTGQAHTYTALGYVCHAQGRHTDALSAMQLALEHFRIDLHRDGQARALNGIGWCHALLGNHHQALIHCEKALSLHRENGNRHGEAGTLDSLGYAHHHLGHSRESIRCFQSALSIYREIGNRRQEAEVLTHLGDAQDAADGHHVAQETWREALAILDDLRHPDAELVRAKLREAAMQ